MTEIDQLAIGINRFITFVVGSVFFLVAVWVMYRARHDDAMHPDQPEQRALPFRRTLVAALLAFALAWPATVWAVPLYYCNGPLWYLMVECWF